MSCRASRANGVSRRQSLTPAIAFGLIGMALGAFFIAPLADSYGRRRLVVYSVIVFAILTIATAYATTLPTLIALRFFTGLGLGGAMPNAIAITAEFSPAKWRTWIVAVMFCFYSLGAGFGGLIAAWLVPVYTWKAVLIFCGGMALALWPILWFAMPESYVPEGEHKPKLPVGRLFAEGRARITIFLWIIFFANLMEIFFLTSWLPLTLSQQGLSEANSAYATSLVQFAGVGAAILMGPLVDSFGTATRPACGVHLDGAFGCRNWSRGLRSAINHDHGGRDWYRHGRRPELQQWRGGEILSDIHSRNRCGLGACGRPDRLHRWAGCRRNFIVNEGRYSHDFPRGGGSAAGGCRRLSGNGTGTCARARSA
jgi:MFS family permease